jgi:hypothetical protein
VPAIVIALEICRSCLPAEIAIDALIVHVEFSARVLAVFVCWVGHLGKLLNVEGWVSFTRFAIVF